MSIKDISIIKKRSYPEIHEIKKNFRVSENGEICLAIGGDGTFLKAATMFDCPILHIRSGEKSSLGFRADVTLGDVKEIIKELKQGRYVVDRYSKLRLTYRNKTFNAVNDIVLFRGSAKTIHFKVNYYNEEGKEFPLYPGEIRGDGVIFTRQIGSTAYNYFARGPILFDIDAIAVTPIAANNAFSIVTNRDFHVTITKRPSVLGCDGVDIAKLHEEDSFTITNSDNVVKVVRLKNYKEQFADKLARLRNF